MTVVPIIRGLRRYGMLLSLFGAFALAASCFRSGQPEEPYIPLAPSEATQAARIAQEFWGANQTGDSAQIQRLITGDGAKVWAQRWRTAYPTFFDSTTGRVVYKHGYFLTPARDTAIVEVEVPWVTCGPPVHEGKPDRYFLRLVRALGPWTIVNVWSDPC